MDGGFFVLVPVWGLFYLFIVFRSSRTASFCSFDSETQSLNNSLRSSFISISSLSSSAKNCESVIPKALQIDSSVAIDGTVLRLKIFPTVDSERPLYLLILYSVQPRFLSIFRNFSFTSISDTCPSVNIVPLN